MLGNIGQRPTTILLQQKLTFLPKSVSDSLLNDRTRNGKVQQRVYYDKNGNADLDVDYFHAVNHKISAFTHLEKW